MAIFAGTKYVLSVRSHLGMRDRGYVEGGNLIIEWRTAEGKLERIPEILRELVSIPVDVMGRIVDAFEAKYDIPVTVWRGGSEVTFAATGGVACWVSGAGGVGYETEPGGNSSFENHIGLDVLAAWNYRTSICARYRFQVSNPAAVSELVLRMRIERQGVGGARPAHGFGIRDAHEHGGREEGRPKADRQ